jgi:hypothetical protein
VIRGGIKPKRRYASEAERKAARKVQRRAQKRRLMAQAAWRATHGWLKAAADAV